MDEPTFKKHLRDLVHGHHHPEEHDWAPDKSVSGSAAKAAPKRARPAKAAKTRRRSK